MAAGATLEMIEVNIADRAGLTKFLFESSMVY